MNEDFKIDLYKKLISVADPLEMESMKKSLCILFANKKNNNRKGIYFYSSDLCDDGVEVLQLEYIIELFNGDSKEGNCIVDTDDILAAFNFKTYNDLKRYFYDKYVDKDDAWQSIIQEIKDKGLNPSIDESDTYYNI